MNTRVLLKIIRGVRFEFGTGAAENVICLLRRETRRYVGLNGEAVLEYCRQNGLDVKEAEEAA